MNFLFALSFFLFAVLAITQMNNERSFITKLSLCVYALLVLTTLSLPIGPMKDVTYLIGLQSIIICVGCVWPLSLTEKFSQLKWLLPPILLLPMLLIGGKQYAIGDFSFTVNGALFPLMFFGTLIATIEKYLLMLTRKLVASYDEDSMRKAMDVFFIGFAAFVGHFFALHIGVLALALGIVLGEIINESNKIKSMVLLQLAFSLSFIYTAGVDSVDISMGKTLEGFLFGLFSVYFLNAIFPQAVRNKLRFLLGLIFVLGLLLWLYFLGTQKADLGGKDAFIAALIGSSIGTILIAPVRWTLIFFSALAAGSLNILPDTMKADESMPNSLVSNSKVKTDNVEKEEAVSLFEVTGSPLDELKNRSFQIDEKNVTLNFQLGPKGGITKGVIRSLNGNVSFGSEWNKVNFNIEIPVNQLSTRNQYRDESLMSKDYFDVEQYPFMNFKADKLEKENEYYVLKGIFTMLGKKQPLSIQMKFIGNKNGKPMLVGKSSIDRTKFGMQPDSREGNVVDFEFQVSLLEN